MQTAVSTKDISTALCVSERAVQIRAKKEQWSVALEKVRGGEKQRYRPNLLPGDVRSALTMRSAEEKNLIESRPDTVTIISINIPDTVKETGLAKFQLVQAFRLAKDTAPWGKKKEAADSFLIAYNTGRLLPIVFQKLGAITNKTIVGYDKKLRDNNNDYSILCDGRGGWRKHGTTKWRERKLSNDAKSTFLQCYLQPQRPSIVMAIRAARIILSKNNVVELAEDITYRRWLKDYENDNSHVICLARDGMKAYQDKYGPYISRDGSMLSPGQCLVADGKVLNFMILHPKTGKPCRMILIVFFDWASRCPMGWQIMPTEDTIAIMAAFRNAAVRLGRYPDSVYLDNGRAFKSKFFTQTDPDFEELNGLYARVGTATHFAKPYNGRSKVVERFFLTVQEQCECLMPSFCGDSILNKPAWMHRNEKFHKALHEAKTQNWVPSIRDAAHIIESYFNWYEGNPHNGIGGKRPVDMLTPHLGPGIPSDQLANDFLWTKQLAARNCRVRLYGIDYEADFLHGKSLTNKLFIKYDTADLSTIYCYTRDNQYLGEAYPVQALHPLAKLFGDEVAVSEVKDQIKRQNRMARNTKEQLLELGASAEDTIELNALPYNRREAITVNNALPAPVDESLSDDEVSRLKLITLEAEKEQDIAPSFPRPEFWESDLHHYQWGFSAMYEHRMTLSEEDEAFMAYFEKTSEFKESYQNRFNDLKDLYSMQNNTDVKAS